MTPTPEMLNALQALLAEDPATLAPVANAVRVYLVMANFNPNAVLVPADIVPATFVGGDFLEAGVGPQQAFVDPITGNRIIQLLEPAGGWHWQATATTDLPQTIYGVAVIDNGVTKLFATILFDQPITITGIGDAVDVDQVRFQMPSTALE